MKPAFTQSPNFKSASADDSPMTKQRYREATHQAYYFASRLQGDGGYSAPGYNRLALEMLIAGWISAQPWFVYWTRALAEDYPNDDAFLHLQDWALELATDLRLALSPAHNLNLSRKEWASKTRLQKKIDKAKAKLGISI